MPADLSNASLLAAGDSHPLFSLLGVMLTAVVVVSLLLIKVRQSLLVGYFVCGILIANTGIIDRLGAEDGPEVVRQMAEFGIMLLMFVLGLEFSISELRFLRRYALVGGVLQMGICIAVVLIVARIGDISWPGAAILGVALGMSSTAVSLKTFQDMELAGSPGARFALGVAIFQDLFIIAFLVFLPLLLRHGSEDGAITRELGLLVARGGLFIALAWINARWVVPRLLHAVVLTRSRELFTLTVVGCCVGLAFVGSLLGLSLALGAFVAGLAISESVYKHRIMADILPFRDLFLTLFFVSVGLLVDVGVAFENWRSIAVITALLVLSKTIVITGIAWFVGLANRQALLGALSLCSAGEFSLLLLQKTSDTLLLSAALQQSLIVSVAIAMGLVPGLMRLAGPLSDWMNDRGLGRIHGSSKNADAIPLRERTKQLSRHAIICGYGPVGRALNRALLGAGVPTLVIELNADTVHRLMEEDQPVLFADAAHQETWELAKLSEAVLVAFTFPDASTAAAAQHHVRHYNPEVCVLARSRFAADQVRLDRLGVNVVIHDEGEVAAAAVAAGLRIVSGGRDGMESAASERATS